MPIKTFPSMQLAQIEANKKNSKARKYKWIVWKLDKGGYIVVQSTTQYVHRS